MVTKKIEKVSNKIRWTEQFKIKPKKNASMKHEVIKTLIVLNLLKKYKKVLYWVRIDTEHEVGDGRICDVYFENIKTNEIVCYEIKDPVTTKWLREANEFYDKYERIYFNTEWALVNGHDLSDDIDMLDIEIRELIL